MRKVICLLLFILLIFSLVACNSDNTDNSDDGESSVIQSSNKSEATIEDKTETKNDKNINASSSNLKKANESKKTSTTETEKNDSTNKETHKHNFSVATCTEPQKCSCGATKGSALGHKWQEATCQNPETCKNCGITKGQKTNHNFVNYVCTTCGCNDEYGIAIATNPRLSFKPKIYYCNHYVDDNKIRSDQLYFLESNQIAYGVCFCVPFVDPSYHTGNANEIPQDINQTDWGGDFYTIYNGKKFYYNGGSGYLVEETYFKLTDTEIIVFSKNNDILKFRLNIDGTLTVTYSTLSTGTNHKPYFLVGDICR